jgi:hypothetical protein
LSVQPERKQRSRDRDRDWDDVHSAQGVGDSRKFVPNLLAPKMWVVLQLHPFAFQDSQQLPRKVLCGSEGWREKDLTKVIARDCVPGDGACVNVETDVVFSCAEITCGI